jgi:multicomponent Na+:H+ antiporter subunit F
MNWGMLTDVTTIVCQAMLGAAMLLTTVRLMRGPSLTDRVIALDLLSLLVIGMVGVHIIATDDVSLLAAALVLALLAFLGTVSFARYLEKTKDVQ